MRFGCRLICLAAMVLSAGCDSGPKTVAVQGEVSFGGRGVERGKIDLYPVDGTPGPSAAAIIANGRYKLSGKDGLVSNGTYLVRITALKKTGKMVANRLDPSGPPVELQDNYIPAIYNSESTLKLHVADLPDKNKVDFQLGATSLPAGR